MDLYYASKHQKNNGRHEVHVLGCPWLPEEEHRTYLGMFTDCMMRCARHRSCMSM